MTPIEFIAVLASGGLASFLTYLVNKKKAVASNDLTYATATKRLAEAAKIKVDAEVSIAKEWMQIAIELQRQINELKKEQVEERKQCEERMALLKSEIDKLKKQV